jgi:hypothetical protein
MFGIFLDVTQRKQAEEANELLAGEMSHRLKNLLTVATALTQMSSRSAASKEDMAQELTSRLIALGRAQDLVRPVPGRNREGTLLGDLISVLLAPYDEKGASVRIRVSVPKMNVGEASSTALALVMHELATNSANTARCRCQVAPWTYRATPTRTRTRSWSSGRSGVVLPLSLQQSSKASEASWCTEVWPPSLAGL